MNDWSEARWGVRRRACWSRGHIRSQIPRAARWPEFAIEVPVEKRVRRVKIRTIPLQAGITRCDVEVGPGRIDERASANAPMCFAGRCKPLNCWKRVATGSTCVVDEIGIVRRGAVVGIVVPSIRVHKGISRTPVIHVEIRARDLAEIVVLDDKVCYSAAAKSTIDLVGTRGIERIVQNHDIVVVVSRSFRVENYCESGGGANDVVVDANVRQRCPGEIVDVDVLVARIVDVIVVDLLILLALHLDGIGMTGTVYVVHLVVVHIHSAVGP